MSRGPMPPRVKRLAADDGLGDQHRRRHLAVEGDRAGGLHGRGRARGIVEAMDDGAGNLQRHGDPLAHVELPRIELAPFAAHGHQHQQGQAAFLGQREHVDAVADPAALHQQHTALATEPGAGQQRHAFLLGAERHAGHPVMGGAAVDQAGMARIRHVGDLAHLQCVQLVEDGIRPVAHTVLPRPAPSLAGAHAFGKRSTVAERGGGVLQR
jgi:hypothetical protein